MPHYFVECYDCDARDCEERFTREYVQGATFIEGPPSGWVKISQGHSRYFCPMHKVVVEVELENEEMPIYRHVWNGNLIVTSALFQEPVFGTNID